MLLTKYGDFEFKYNGEIFTGKCSLGNLTKLGTPQDIIYKVHRVNDYWIARMILQCFIDGDLPSFCEDEPINRLGARRANQDTRAFVITMAKHCIYHSMTGKVKDNVEHSGKSESVTEFDPYEFIESAIELLDLTMEQAANLSMSEYIARIEAKPWYKEARKKEKENGLVSPAESLKLMNEQREMDRKLRERLKAAS